VGLDDIGITLTLIAFFGIRCWLIYRWFFQPPGPRGAVLCYDCAIDLDERAAVLFDRHRRPDRAAAARLRTEHARELLVRIIEEQSS
jgi:hypothetical protein